MLTGKRLRYAIAILLNLILISSYVSAAEQAANSGLKIMQGKVNHIISSRNQLVVDDMSYALASDVRVVTPAGHKGRIESLYPGKRVRILVDFNGNGNIVGTIHKIYMLR